MENETNCFIFMVNAQEEYEARKKIEEETRRLEQEKRLEEERKRSEEARITEENKRREDEKRSRLRREEQKAPAWHKWQPYTSVSHCIFKQKFVFKYGKIQIEAIYQF